MALNLPTSDRSMVSSSTWLMLAGHWSVFGSAAEFHHNLPMFDRFVVIYFHTDNLCDVGRLLVTFQIKDAVASQPADVLKVNGRFCKNKNQL